MARRAEARPNLELKAASYIKRSAADMVAESLRAAILSHTLKGGTPLIEKQLAEAFEVSKTPVREALLRLAQTGLVDFAHAKGATVHTLSFNEMKDILDMRQVLEPIALRQSAPNLMTQDLQELGRILQEATQAQVQLNFAKLSALNSKFHTLLYSRADNELLRQWLNGLSDRRRLISVKGWMSENRSAEELKEHGAILEAVKAKDYDLAVSHLERHIEAFSSLVLRRHPLAKEAA